MSYEDTSCFSVYVVEHLGYIDYSIYDIKLQEKYSFVYWGGCEIDGEVSWL